MIGLGCMRLSTRPDRDTLDAEGVIHAALVGPAAGVGVAAIALAWECRGGQEAEEE
jgi:hypothetical protein